MAIVQAISHILRDLGYQTVRTEGSTLVRENGKLVAVLMPFKNDVRTRYETAATPAAKQAIKSALNQVAGMLI